MNPRSMIRTLIRFYPLEWRVEYGDELESMLSNLPLTAGQICNVVAHGVLQRIRFSPMWKIAGLALALKLIIGTIINSIWPFSHILYSLFFEFDLVLALFVGALAVLRDGKSIRVAMGSAALAATLGMIPEMALGLLWAAQLVHPTILGLNGAPYILGRGVTDLCLRGQFSSPLPLLFLSIPTSAVPAGIMGLLGGSVAAATRGLGQRLRRG